MKNKIKEVYILPVDQGAMGLLNIVKPGYNIESIIRKNTKATVNYIKEN